MPDHTPQSPRRLRIFAFDPSLGRRHATAGITTITAEIPAHMDPLPASDEEPALLGPVGEYLAVIDVDPASGVVYAPVDLNDPRLLMADGLAPDESDPQFHQQMVYAVAMTTIATFEKALGRVALWAHRTVQKDGQYHEDYIGRLRIYPHALRQANAFYDPEKCALLFGYFQADEPPPQRPARPGRGQAGATPARAAVVPGQTVFTCLSHDVIAHETTHALLDGLHPRWAEVTNRDTLALHEGFADIVAIFQHFSYPEVLRDQIAGAEGDLGAETLMAQLAQEFGSALSGAGALRDALGYEDATGWHRRSPDPRALGQAEGPHARGAILVSAVFDAFLTIYRARTADLMRIASGGTGILPPGALHPDLVNRLADAAAKSARHILVMCIRALDYCPPTDVSFGDYLRAILTADHDLYPQDPLGYRTAVLEAFLAWGIYPPGRRSYSVKTLLWPTLEQAVRDGGEQVTEAVRVAITAALVNPESVRKRLEHRGSYFYPLMDKAELYARRILEGLNQEKDRRLQEADPERKSEEMREALDASAAVAAGVVNGSVEALLARNLLEQGLGADRATQWRVQDFYGLLFWALLTTQTHPVAKRVGRKYGLEIDEYRHRALLEAAHLCIDPKAPWSIARSPHTRGPRIDVDAVRVAERRGIQGQTEREYVVEVTQYRRGYMDLERQKAADRGEDLKRTPYVPGDPIPEADFIFRRGCTFLIDARSYCIRRVIRTAASIDDDAELDRLRAFLAGRRNQPLNAFTDSADDPGHLDRAAAFAALHRGCRGAR